MLNKQERRALQRIIAALQTAEDYGSYEQDKCPEFTKGYMYAQITNALCEATAIESDKYMGPIKCNIQTKSAKS